MQAGKIKEGSLVLLTAFGGGVTWGGTLVRF
jgi:3-oxoacyl-[acyl-carrier-protein] synthase III